MGHDISAAILKKDLRTYEKQRGFSGADSKLSCLVRGRGSLQAVL